MYLKILGLVWLSMMFAIWAPLLPINIIIVGLVGGTILASLAWRLSKSVEDSVLGEVAAERRRQESLWGESNHPDGTGRWYDEADREVAQRNTDQNTACGQLTWRDILTEEVAEAYAETDPVRIREELIQVAAVAVKWVEAIDRRNKLFSLEARRKELK